MCDHEQQQPASCEHETETGADPWREFYGDSLFKKQDWDLEDWQSYYDKMPSSDGCEGTGMGIWGHAEEVFWKEAARVFFPLCGKTEDMRWAYDRGHTVVGLEAIETPVRLFFERHRDLGHSVEELEYGKLYKSKDRRLQVFVCDVTDIPLVVLGKFDVVVDCGAYVSIHPRDRTKYVETVTSALEKDYRYFLEVCHDAPPGATGLPHSVSFGQLKRDFGPLRKLKFLSTEDISEEWGVDTFFQTYLVMTPKNE
ncbi:thiopurine S-methyltransferase-like [Penaeus japonicus]|uniref:thiopurine S-methyltransferase-like n=1 Tax=Penaeus japonicus TaxID=27405 RepID=UPI001C70E1AA|nr:thiopurine S-methyltransferase-like [Penaeus japonicus]XP_042875844.1 thiopurine S-methyltransferase-like [Penaeus japonicus]